MKRTLSFLLVLAIVAGMFAGLRLPAEAADASYNKGKREEVCTSLSAAARKYYTGSYTFDQLSALKGSSLRTKLRALVSSGRSTVGYDGLKRYFPHTDAFEGSSKKLVLFYCNGTTGSAWDSAKTWNREHMWPDSKGGSAMEGDLHAMRPTDPNTNSTRGNSKYGEVNGGKAAYTNEANGSLLGGHYVSGTFEPLDFAKGDCARTILYDYVVTGSMSSVGIVFQDVDTMLNWCKLDPVDTYEMSRNDVAEEIQGCRNPFVDYPQLAWLLMDRTIPSDLITPDGGGGTEPKFTITVSSNDTAMGTVKLEGNTVVASPKQGCYAASYSILKGEATVSREGNLFTVEAKSDCSIRINFARKESVTVSFHGKASAVTVYLGESITLPTASHVGDYEFIGWVEQPVEKTKVKPDYRTPGSSYTAVGNVDFYALYQIVEDGSGTGLWTLVTEESRLRSGAELVLASNANGKTAGDITATYLTPVDSSFSSDMSTITGLGEQTVILTLGGSEGAWTLTDRQGRQLGCSGKKSLGWGAGTLTWDIRIDADGAHLFSTMSDYGRILYNTSAPRFTTYTGNPAKALPLPQLYMVDGKAGTVYYTTDPETDTPKPCDHSEALGIEGIAPDCTSTGMRPYYVCEKCGGMFADASCTRPVTEEELILPMTDHKYGKAVTAPTCTAKGYTVYACDVCGHSYRDNETPALGHDYVAGEGSSATCTQGGTAVYTCSRCKDSYTDTAAAPLGHDWDEGKVTLAPTSTQTGIMSYTCRRCGAVKAEMIPVLGNDEPKDPYECELGEKCGCHVFEDMPFVGFWSHEGIDYVLNHGLFKGMTETYFGLDIAMTRGMLISVLWRQMGSPKTELGHFEDVHPEAYYAEAVAWAAENGIVMGATETLFKPEDKITREQLAAVLFRFANFCKMDTTARAELTAFSDAKYAYDYAMEPLKWAVATGLIQGVSEVGTPYLRPQGDATRSQVASILMRFLENSTDGE